MVTDPFESSNSLINTNIGIQSDPRAVDAVRYLEKKMEDNLKQRDLGVFFLLMIVTLGLYTFYLIPKLGVSVNRLVKKDEFKFVQVLLVGIFTLGIGLAVFEVLYAYCLQKNPEFTRGKWSTTNLGGYVLVLNILAWLLVFASGGLAFVLCFFLGCWATWLIQQQVNQYIVLSEQFAAADPGQAPAQQS